ncbi:uncharacterized protein LOC127106552 [Lathyrus oleraceus]|uniref:uncharacterized protein LOC127106552 n=1 Tax=Pisum sativum TaxID=3888 RepID=UPI0021D2AC13|nr:uncharacterized protein LOC127106552 [Pisum sativum]
MSKEELKKPIEAHEKRMEERNNEKAKTEIALQAHLNEKDKRSKGRWHMKSKGNFQNYGGRESQSSKNSTCQRGEYSSSRLRDNINNNSGNAAKTGYNRLHESYNRLHAEENVMVIMRKGIQCNKEWYLDSGCSTHSTGRKDWFIKINCAMKNKVKFADDTTLAVDEIDDVLIMRMDGGLSLIKDVLYILGIICNLLNISQFLEKGNRIHMENKGLRVMDVSEVLVLKAPMDANRTIKFELKVMEHRCLAKEVSQEDWMWHYHLGHLNFPDLKDLQKNGMVMGFPLINISAEICGECV